jgi:hypothetical protein
MSQSQLKSAVIVLGVATGLIHLYLNVRLGYLDIPFTLNGLGYLALSTAIAVPLPMLAGKEKLLHYGFMGFTLITIIGWLVIGNKSDLLGIVDKVIEVLLIVALWLRVRHLGNTPSKTR